MARHNARVPEEHDLAKIEMAIRDAIVRGARKHIRSAATPLRRDVRRLRQAVRELRAQLAALRDVAARWEQSQAGRGWQPAVSEEDVPGGTDAGFQRRFAGQRWQRRSLL